MLTTSMNINEPYLSAVDSSLGLKPRLKAGVRMSSVSNYFAKLFRPDDVMTFRCAGRRPRGRDLEL